MTKVVGSYMAAPKFSTCVVAFLLVASLVAGSSAQEFDDINNTPLYVDNTDHDLQFFSPVNFDFENQPISQSNGYYFGYDKLSWAFTGERTTIGNPGGTADGSMSPFRIFEKGEALNEDTGVIVPIPGTEILIPAPFLPNGIQNAPPRANFAWGERYELGYFDGDNGTMVGILDGPESNQVGLFGFGATRQDGTNGLLSPLGSVYVNFEIPTIGVVPTALGDTPISLMHGFLDVQEGVSSGVLAGDDNGDGILDGDGVADDIDRDGQFGPVNFQVGGSEPDYDDLVELPTSFQTLEVRNSTQMQGIELMHTYKLDNRHRMVKHQNNFVEMSYGVRYLRLRDEFDVTGVGGVLGDSFWDTHITNNLVGPQIALKWMRQQRRVRWDLGSRFLFGYNIQNWEQEAAIGEDLIPGQLNHPIYLGPTYSTHGKQKDDFSPLVELRVQGSYQITRALAAKLGYTATFIDNISRASQQVRYRLPEMGFRPDNRTQEIFINGVNFGFEAVY